MNVNDFAPITRVEDHGTVVGVTLGDSLGVLFDRTPFRHMVEAQVGGDVDSLIGLLARPVWSEGGVLSLQFEDTTIHFCDECHRDLAWQHAPDCASGAAHNILSGEWEE